MCLNLDLGHLVLPHGPLSLDGDLMGRRDGGRGREREGGREGEREGGREGGRERETVIHEHTVCVSEQVNKKHYQDMSVSKRLLGCGVATHQDSKYTVK